MFTRTKLTLAALFALVFSYAAPLHAQNSYDYGPFFDSEVFVGYDSNNYAVYYLQEFGYYTYLGTYQGDTPYPGYLYKYNFGFLYDFGNSQGNVTDVYLYDFGQDQSLGVIYTALNYGSDANNFYFYDFDDAADYVYFQDTYRPREFYNFDTRQYVNLY